MMKRYSLTDVVILAMLPFVVACQWDDMYDMQSGTDFSFNLALEFSSKADTGTDTLMHRARGNTEFVLCAYAGQDGCGMGSKAAPVLDVPDSVRLFSYRYLDWGENVNPVSQSGMLLARDGSLWKTEEKMLFDKSDPLCSMRHYAIAPYNSESITVLDVSGGLTLKYTVPEEVELQEDILFGSSLETGSDERRVNMTFAHILSSVCFAVDSQCSDAVVNYVKLKNVYRSAVYTPDLTWSDHSEKAAFTLFAGASVVNGEESMISEGERTMMLLPQILPEDAILQICLTVEGEEIVLETGIGGQKWAPGASYLYRLHFVVDMYDSSITYEIDMNHKINYVQPSTSFCLPAMSFDEGTEKIKVDWGDGTTEVYTSKPGNGYKHSFPSTYVGIVNVSIKGSSPSFTLNEVTTQQIRKIQIRNNERYDSRDDCNCIIETAKETLVYAGADYHIPEGVTIIGPRSLLAVEDRVLVIPEGITKMNFSALYGTSLYVTEVVLPASLTKIEDGAIYSYNRLEKISVGPGNMVYDSRYGCNCVMETASDYLVVSCRTSVIPDETKGIKDYACTVSPLAMVLPESCLKIGNNAFVSNTRIKEITIPAGCVVGSSAFEKTQPDFIDYSAGNITLGPSAFAHSQGIDTLRLDRFKSIGASAFKYFKGLVDVIIPESYVLPREAFLSCPDLGYVNIPANCVINKGVFKSCPSLRRVDLHSTPAEYSDSYCFAFCENLIQLNVYDGCIKLNSYDIFSSPVNVINWYSSKSPQFTQLNVSVQTGEFHTLNSCDFSSWFIQTNLYDIGWTIINDLKQ